MAKGGEDSATWGAGPGLEIRVAGTIVTLRGEIGFQNVEERVNVRA